MPSCVVERLDHVLVFTLNKPDVRNALDDDMTETLAAALDEASRDLSVRAMVLTGAGAAFCSGADTRNIQGRKGVFAGAVPPATRHGYTHGIQRLTSAFYACEVPLIAAVNGPALGLGFDLAIQCDVRVASETATFSEAFISMGLIPGDCGFWYLPRLVGYSRAVEMTLTGQRIDAATAERWGLVSEVVGEGQALDAALRIASAMSSRSPHAVRLSKRLIRDGLQAPIHTAMSLGAMAQAVLTGAADQRAAVAAMKDKRDAVFTDA